MGSVLGFDIIEDFLLNYIFLFLKFKSLVKSSQRVFSVFLEVLLDPGLRFQFVEP